ncbi:hypothetical protein HAX54_036071 [Datura stramonium]|uniref:AMP-binding enzyme C-terminal domain-containing protein n=1 Tax=Datura stramonium TaxID=4076 RepID=A0ABS8SG47_DATST|nr:hypothetical protein [Datura stramonium]
MVHSSAYNSPDSVGSSPQQTRIRLPEAPVHSERSAALAPSVMARLEEVSGAPVLEAYAMTEATHLMASEPNQGVDQPWRGEISPIEVDAVLVSHPKLLRLLLSEFLTTSMVKSYSKRRSNIDEAEVLRFCKKNLAAFKVPKKVFMTDSLPKTASGKIQRRLVAEHFLAQISTAKVPKFGA